MEVVISTSKLIDAIKEIANKTGASCSLECEEAIIKIPSDFGQGEIKGINFQNGLGLFVIDCSFKEDVIIKYDMRTPYPLRILFCMDGKFSHAFEQKKLRYELEPMHSSISASSDSLNQSFYFPANTTVTFSSLEIERKEYIKKVDCELDTIPEQLAEVFRDTWAEDPFLYMGSYSIAIAETINQIHYNEYKGLVRKSFLESKALELFSLMLRQYRDDHHSNNKKVVLRKTDIDLIVKAKDIMTNDLQKSYTIKALAKMVGLNEYKLKKGFKEIYDSTINRYILEKRLDHAKILLIDGTLSIKEVAEKVGYSSVSFFTKKFKKKFGILPKDYVKTLQIEVE